MLHKTRRSRLRETGAYIWGSDPRDEWEFVLEDRKCRIVNGWRSGIALFVDDIEVGRSLQFFSVTGLSPLLAVDVSDGQGRQRRVEVYVRAIIDVKIQVRVDGIPIHHGFL